MPPAIGNAPLGAVLLAAAALPQALAFLAVLARRMFGPAERGLPRWPFVPLVLGAGAGVWYAVLQRDLVFGAAQGVALCVGSLLMAGRRG